MTTDLFAEAQGNAPGRARLVGRRILVVGGGQQTYDMPDAPIGNGRAMSILCGREGAMVAVADLNTGAAAETAHLVEAQGAKVLPMTVDATNEAEVQHMIRTVAGQFGGLDGLIVNVGMARGLRLAQTSVADWDWVFALNARAHFLCSKHALPVMEPGGAIVFISSTAAVLPSTSDAPAYVASKAALAGLNVYVAKEAAPKGIRVNLVTPGLIDTSLGRLATLVRPDRAQTPIPLARQGTAWDVAYAAVFLLSNEASYITGQSIVVDGGLSAIR
ncbi:MAG: SDR family oxidoreductase [Syntrophobacteraceae bacterium]